MDMNMYYSFRKNIRELYNKNINTGDLCGRLLEIRDRSRSIESMQIDLASYSIEVEFADGTSEDTKGKTIDKIVSRIAEYIINNASSLDLTNRKEFDKFICNHSNCCDIYDVGNSLKINL